MVVWLIGIGLLHVGSPRTLYKAILWNNILRCLEGFKLQLWSRCDFGDSKNLNVVGRNRSCELQFKTLVACVPPQQVSHGLRVSKLERNTDHLEQNLTCTICSCNSVGVYLGSQSLSFVSLPSVLAINGPSLLFLQWISIS